MKYGSPQHNANERRGEERSVCQKMSKRRRGQEDDAKFDAGVDAQAGVENQTAHVLQSKMKSPAPKLHSPGKKENRNSENLSPFRP